MPFAAYKTEYFESVARIPSPQRTGDHRISLAKSYPVAGGAIPPSKLDIHQRNQYNNYNHSRSSHPQNNYNSYNSTTHVDIHIDDLAPPPSQSSYYYRSSQNSQSSSSTHSNTNHTGRYVHELEDHSAAADSRRFTERRKKTVRFDGQDSDEFSRWENERQESQDSTTKDSGIDTSSTFTSSEDSNRGDVPKVLIALMTESNLDEKRISSKLRPSFWKLPLCKTIVKITKLDFSTLDALSPPKSEMDLKPVGF